MSQNEFWHCISASKTVSTVGQQRPPNPNPSPLLKLPNETLSRIILECLWQDQAYEVSQQNFKEASENLRSTEYGYLANPHSAILTADAAISGRPYFKQYFGLTLARLGSTCKRLYELAVVHRFKRLRLSDAVTPLFLLDILEQHGSSFTEVEFDELSDEKGYKSKTPIEDFLIYVLPKLKNVTSFVFSSFSSGDTVYKCIEPELASNFISKEPEQEELYDLNSHLLDVISSLKFNYIDPYGPFRDLTLLFNGMQSLTVNASCPDDDEIIELGDVLCWLRHLSSLDLTLANQKSATPANIPYNWPLLVHRGYDGRALLELTSLKFASHSLKQYEWGFLSIPAKTLQRIELRFEEVVVEQSEGITSFEDLKELVLYMPTVEDATTIMQHIQAPKLATIHLNLAKLDATQPLTKCTSLLSTLSDFKSSLTSLHIKYLDPSNDIPLAYQAAFEAFTEAMDRPSASSLQSRSDMLPGSWGRTLHLGHPSNCVHLAANVKEVLQYALNQVEQLERISDDDGMQNWADCVMALAARRQVELQ